MKEITIKYKFGRGTNKVKAGSRLSTQKIILHPERIEKARRLAELYRFINPEG